MRKLLLIALFGLAVLAGAPGGALAGQCGLPDARPLWFDYAEGSVPFRKEAFGRPGVIAATSGPNVSRALRDAGARTVYWEMNLRLRVGTTREPFQPPQVDVQARRLFDKAARDSGCATPVLALNELQGAGTTTPWSETNGQYRANVLHLVQALAQRGAHVYLLLSTRPYTEGDAGDWWRSVAQYADLVPEVYFNAPQNLRQGIVLGSRRARIALREAVNAFTRIGIPAERVGFMLGFQVEGGQGGREHLEPAARWFQYVKLQALAAKQVAAELGTGSVWSWGWGVFGERGQDPDKPTAACVYLWTRDPALCDGPAAAGEDFDTSLTAGQISSLPAGVQCTVGTEPIVQADVAALEKVTGDADVAQTALLARIAEAGRVTVEPYEVLAAERTIIFQHFRGSRPLYLAALERSGASLDVARAIVADELRRGKIAATLSVRAPSAADVAEFYRNYPETPVREVAADPAPTWLGGKLEGLALRSLAPAQIFGMKRAATVRTAEGTFNVKPLGDAKPLGSFPLALVSPAIGATLAGYAREDAFDAWSLARQKRFLSTAICLGDDLPQAAPVDLTAYLTYLRLS